MDDLTSLAFTGAIIVMALVGLAVLAIASRTPRDPEIDSFFAAFASAPRGSAADLVGWLYAHRAVSLAGRRTTSIRDRARYWGAEVIGDSQRFGERRLDEAERQHLIWRTAADSGSQYRLLPRADFARRVARLPRPAPAPRPARVEPEPRGPLAQRAATLRRTGSALDQRMTIQEMQRLAPWMSSQEAQEIIGE